MLTFIEWAEFAQNEIPPDSLKINIKYDDKNVDIRIFDFKATNTETKTFMENFKKEVIK